jgi:hypothetical protein
MTPTLPIICTCHFRTRWIVQPPFCLHIAVVCFAVHKKSVAVPSAVCNIAIPHTTDRPIYCDENRSKFIRIGMTALLLLLLLILPLLLLLLLLLTVWITILEKLTATFSASEQTFHILRNPKVNTFVHKIHHHFLSRVS